MYNGDTADNIAFPLGGIGAGMICLDGTGSVSHVSIRHSPKIFNQPYTYSAVSVRGKQNNVRVIEGPVPKFKIFGSANTGNGLGHSTFGLPRFDSSTFTSRFPFGNIHFTDDSFDLNVNLTGWSPFIPTDEDSSSLPLAALEYEFTNTTTDLLSCVYSFNSINFMSDGSEGEAVLKSEKGFTLWAPENETNPQQEGAFNASVYDDSTHVNCSWFRGGWFDSQSMVWKDVEKGNCFNRQPIEHGTPSPGASIYVPFELKPNQNKTIKLLLSWYVPKTNLTYGYAETKTPEFHKPWYSNRFNDINSLIKYWGRNFDSLKNETNLFTDTFYDTDLPDSILESVSANLSILKSPTLLRQADGTLWCWEGCGDKEGFCPGSCTHVWNYAQAVPHLFPKLERSLRETAFIHSQNELGHQRFRAALPVGNAPHDLLAAADGQLGEIMQVYRDWRISGDNDWLKSIWSKVETCMNYCIETWDPKRSGYLLEPQHNTYDIEFWGPNGMCTSIYLGALKAATFMGNYLQKDTSEYKILFRKGRDYCENELFNGEYFFQDTQWLGLKAENPIEFKGNRPAYLSEEGTQLIKKEGPKYQYGKGCLSDGVIGAWLAHVCGIGEILDSDMVISHLKSVYKYNFKPDLSKHANPQRPNYATGKDGGLILCSWPNGSRPSLPFPYSDEVWTGIEYQVASHMISLGLINEGNSIVETTRNRYTKTSRNPFDEYEAGHWYGRALSSYSLIQSTSGVRYDAVEKILYIERTGNSDFKSFLSTDSGFGTVGVAQGKPFSDVKKGSIDIQSISYNGVSI